MRLRGTSGALPSIYRSRLQFGGADASTTFTDDSGKTWTAYGNAQIDTSLGDQRGLFDGSGDYVVCSSSLNFAPSTNFKLQFGLRLNSKSGYQTVMSNGYVTDELNSFVLQTGNGDGLLNIYTKATLIVGESGVTVNAGQDYDIEIERVSGTTVTIKRDGVITGTSGFSGGFADKLFSIGGGSSSGYNNYWFNGWVKDFRVF